MRAQGWLWIQCEISLHEENNFDVDFDNHVPAFDHGLRVGLWARLSTA